MLPSALLLSSSSRAALGSGGRRLRPQALLHVIAAHSKRQPPCTATGSAASSIWTHARQQGRRLAVAAPPRGGVACYGVAGSRRGMATTGGSGSSSSSKPPASASTPTSTAPPSESVGGGGGGGGADGGRAIKAGVIGVAAGVFGSLVGMGGAFVMIPAMTGVLKFSQHQAHGTSLAAVVATGSGGAISYATAAGAVDWEAAAYVAGCGMLTARLGAYCTARLSAATLKRLCGAFQIIVAPMVPFRDQIVAFFKGEDKDGDAQAPVDEEAELWRRRFSLMGIGLGSGFLAGLFGVGGGAVTVPALTLCLGVSHYQALGTSLAAMVPTAVVGTYTHHTHGNVVWSVVAPLALGSLAGSYFGGKEVALRVPEEVLKYGFGIMMVVLGAKTIAAAGPLRAAASTAASIGGKMK